MKIIRISQHADNLHKIILEGSVNKRLQESLKLDIGILLETVVKSSWVMVLDSILVQRISVFSDHFQNELRA